jgi:diketogulonate reductase-like aldo/keto reductase
MKSVPMPGIIYGTAWKGAETAHWVRCALERGFRGLDTAAQPKHYDEHGVGEGLAGALRAGLRRDEISVQTKFTALGGQDPGRIPYDPDAPLAEQVAQSCASSLANLGVDWLDGLVLHSPLARAEDTATVWAAMESLVDRGRVARLGISNCYSPELLAWLHDTARIKPTVVQNRFYARTGYDAEIRAFCRANGIVYQSFWTLSANPELLASPAIARASHRHARTHAQVLFRFLSQSGVVPLSGTRSREHMDEDLAIFDFELDAAELAAIEALLG